MLQLPDIAGPGKFAKLLERVGVGLPARSLIAIGKADRKEIDQLGNVFATFAQRRNVQLDHVQAIIQIFAKAAGRHFGFQIAVRGGDHLHVDVHRMSRTDRSDFLLLQHAQQLGLQVERHFADFVQKDDPLLGGPKHTQRASVGAGEGPLLVTEQLALGQRGRERRAVDRNERFAGCGN